MVEYSREFRRVHKPIWVALALLLVFSFLLQNVAGSVYYSLLMEPNTTVTSPPVILQAGTAGESTIYANNTSAKVSVEPSGTDTGDYVDNNTSDVDSCVHKGTHSNFTAQQYGPDSICDTLTEENTASETYQIHPTSFTDVNSKWNNEANAWDWNNATSANETQTKVINDIYWTTWNNSGSGTIIDVDLRIRIDLTGLVDDYVTVQWWVSSTQGTGTYEINSTNDGTDLSISFNDLSEPNDGSWSWTDIGNIEIRQVGTQPPGPEVVAYAVDEVWGWVTAGSTNYELDLEVQWTSVDFDEPNEEFCIYGGTMGAENITVDVWNGSGWENLFTDLNSGWNNFSVSSYLTSSNFTIRFNGGNETGDTTQNSWDIDATLLHVWTESGLGDFNYVLNMTENHGSNWKVRLSAYDNSSIARLNNCSIYIYDGSNSTQIVILNGGYENQTGPWYDLAASGTEYIWMHVETSSAGTSYVYAYLEIRVPTATIYARYIITFEIT